jgi:hypothetical protein
VEAVDLDLRDGDAVLLRFGTESDGFQVRGRVVRIDTGAARTSYGVRFGGLDPRQVESLYKFVMRHAAGK